MSGADPTIPWDDFPWSVFFLVILPRAAVRRFLEIFR